MIESILFVAGEAVAIPDLARALQIGEDALKKELNRIGSAYDYEQRGFMLKRFGNNVQLATSRCTPTRWCGCCSRYRSRA